MQSIFKGRIEVQKVGAGTAALYGYTRNGGKTWHGGIDVTCPDQPETSTEVYAVEGGTVVQSRIVNNGVGSGTAEWGHYVTVQGEATGLFFTYAHLAGRAVEQGQAIRAGAKLGVMGNTGNAAGGYRHVHFEVRTTAGGKGINPTAYLGIPNAVGVYGTPTAGPADKNKEGKSMYIKVCAPQQTAPRSALVAEGWVQVRHSDGAVKMYNPHSARYAREVAADGSDLSPVYEACASQLQPGEILLAVD